MSLWLETIHVDPQYLPFGKKSSSKEKGEIRIISKLSTIRMLVFHMKIIIRLSVKHVI